jgi:tyrosine decarboxylase/aspartate 1-decarboxylase
MMEEHGKSYESVLESLKKAKSKDMSHNRILSSMCTYPHEIAIEAHKMFIESNIGDAGLFPGTKGMEEEVIRMLGSLFHNPAPFGYVTTGGTESNIQAIRSFRNMRGKEKPNIVVPASAHFSFDKIADILGVEVKRLNWTLS